MELIIGKTAGFCYGVKRAVEGAKKELKTNKVVYGLGEIVHNQEVVKQLEDMGMQFIDDIKQAKGSTIIRAHGITKQIYEKAEQNYIHLIDYTCPKVLKIHEIAEEYAKKGYYTFLLGDKKHPEIIGTLSYCGKDTYIIEKEDDTVKALEALQKSAKKKLLVISQTTYSLEKFYIIEEIIKNELPINMDLIVKNTICQATEIRQQQTEEISKKVDYMIIIGGKNSSNTKKLYDIARQNCGKVMFIENEKELDIDNIEEQDKIGIMAGASTPEESILKVVEKLHKYNKGKLEVGTLRMV